MGWGSDEEGVRERRRGKEILAGKCVCVCGGKGYFVGKVDMRREREDETREREGDAWKGWKKG